MKRSIYIGAPVEKVFDFFKDPRNMLGVVASPFALTDVTVTAEGVGTYYSWASKTPVLRYQGFDVFTEFIPNQRITDRSSAGLPGDWTFSFEPEGPGTQLTVDVRHRSFWRIPPVRELVEWGQGPMTERFLAAVKTKIEARPVFVSGSAQA